MKIRAGLVATSVLLCIFSVGVSSAEMYKWVDKDGVIHLQDSPPEGMPNSTRVEKLQFERSPETISEPQQAAPRIKSRDNRTVNTNAEVEIYITSWCPYCKKAKEYLNSKGIAYTEYDIEKDQDALDRKNELSPNGGVPVAVFDGRVIRGFSSKKYDTVFGGRP